MVVGDEWADRVSPYAGARVVDDPELTRCWICDEPTTSCSDAALHTRLAAEAAIPTVDTEGIVMARAKAQTPARTVPPRVTKDNRPNLDQGAQTPAEGGQTLQDAPTVAPPNPLTEKVLDGEGYEQVIQLSPITADTGAQTTHHAPVTIPVGDPSSYRDVIDEPPPGKVDPRTDPQRPRHRGVQGVLVSREEQWAQTGAWTSDPSNSRMVILTRDVHKVEYAWSNTQPTYKLFRRRFSRMPKPR